MRDKDIKRRESKIDYLIEKQLNSNDNLFRDSKLRIDFDLRIFNNKPFKNTETLCRVNQMEIILKNELYYIAREMEDRLTRILKKY